MSSRGSYTAPSLKDKTIIYADRQTERDRDRESPAKIARKKRTEGLMLNGQK